MNRNTKIYIGIATVIVIMAITIWVTTPNGNIIKQNEQKNIIPTPEKTIIPTRTPVSSFSETGARYVSPTESEYTQMTLIGDLRDKCPIENSAFKIDFDYKVNKFVVTIKEPKETNKKLYEKWMEEAGYNQIDSQYFEPIL